MLLELLLSLMLLELLLSLTLQISALQKGADGAGGLPSATPSIPAPASTAGALRVAGRTHPRHVEVGLAVQVCYPPSALT